MVLAGYGATVKLPLWQPPAAEVVELKALLSRLEALEADSQRESNRLEKAEVAMTPRVVLDCLSRIGASAAPIRQFGIPTASPVESGPERDARGAVYASRSRHSRQSGSENSLRATYRSRQIEDERFRSRDAQAGAHLLWRAEEPTAVRAAPEAKRLTTRTVSTFAGSPLLRGPHSPEYIRC